MKKETNLKQKANIQEFHLPKYSEIPNVGLYLEQVAKYINGYLEPLACMELTTSMISNYVKKGIVSNPVKKQYYAEQIAYLFFIAVAKNVLSIENIHIILKMQKEVYDCETAYNYFCEKFQQMLRTVFYGEEILSLKNEKNYQVKNMLQSVLFATAHMVYLNDQFVDIRLTSEQDVKS